MTREKTGATSSRSPRTLLVQQRPLRISRVGRAFMPAAGLLPGATNSAHFQTWQITILIEGHWKRRPRDFKHRVRVDLRTQVFAESESSQLERIPDPREGNRFALQLSYRA